VLAWAEQGPGSRSRTRISRTQPRRGAVEHFYRAVTRPFIDDDEWTQMPVAMRRGFARVLFRRIFAEASAAGASGGFDRPGAHVDRMPLELDDRGWRELSNVLTAALEQAAEVERRCDARRSGPGSDGRVTQSRLAILHFDVGAGVSPDHAGRGRSDRADPAAFVPLTTRAATA
jgi:hypothetical protein